MAIARQADGGELQPVDYMLIGFILFLFVACIWAIFALLIPRLRSGGNPTFNFSNLGHVLLLMLIYTLCVIAGWLWGRYQSKTAEGRENIRLRQNIATLENNLLTRGNDVIRLEAEKARLMGQIRTLQSATAVSGPGKTTPGLSALDPVRVLTPPPSIYDNPRDPDDPGDLPLHPHLKTFPERDANNKLPYGWRIIAASRRGYGHAYEGKYREDDFHVRIFNASGQSHHPDIALIAIADGVGSKSLSRRGARAAVLGAVEVPEKRLIELRSFIGKNALYQQSKETAYYLLAEGLLSARKKVEQAAQEAGASIDDLQSTLLVFLVAPWDEQHLFVASTQIGDGGLLALQPRKGRVSRNAWQWLQQPQIGGSGNEVQPFMRTGSELWRSFYRAELLDHAACIIGMTDGTADDIEPPRPTQNDPHPDPFALVDDFYQRIIYPAFSQAQSEEALLKLLGYQKKQSHDDRTIVCLYR